MLSQPACGILIIHFSWTGCPCGGLLTSVPSLSHDAPTSIFYFLFPLKIQGKTVDFLRGISIKDLSDSTWIWEICHFCLHYSCVFQGYFISSLHPEGKQWLPWPPELIPSSLPSHKIMQLWSFFRAQTTCSHSPVNPRTSPVLCLLWQDREGDLFAKQIKSVNKIFLLLRQDDRRNSLLKIRSFLRYVW